MKKPASDTMPRDFLLELGCEELPADYLPEAMRALAVHAAEAFGPEHGFAWRTLEVWASPRRLVLLLRDVAPVVRWEKVGPSKQAAYAAQGQPTPAAQGFAKSQGVPVSALQVKETPKGPCVVAAHSAPVVPKLAEAVPALVKALRFPKQMRWESSGATFARPIRWVAALYGSEIVPCRVAGVASGRRTAALRRSSLRHGSLRHGSGRAGMLWLTVPSAEKYHWILTHAGIHLERRWQPLAFPPTGPLASQPAPPKGETIRHQLAAAARAAGGRLDAGEEFEELLTHVTFLAEQPVVAVGAFRPDYLTLPPEVLATAMAKYLKVFSLREAAAEWSRASSARASHEAGGRLLPTFLAVLEGRPTNIQGVMAHYERILEARFADAQFFWHEDTKTPLEKKADQLPGVVFHKQLATLHEKTLRLWSAVGTHRVAPPTPAFETSLRRAIQLAKCDLVTQMVKEFPTLQGVVGAEYARHDGEPAEVVQALREQYAPRTAKDPLPTSEIGTWLSLLDRADTLTGFFGVGLAPTSSEDPYGLRRQALGLVRILVEKPLTLSLDTLLDAALESWGARLTIPANDVRRQLRVFLNDRFRWWAEAQEYPRELVDAVLMPPARTGDLADVAHRLRVLHELWRDETRRTAVLFPAGKVLERTGRIVASAKKDGAGDGASDPAKFTAPDEQALWDRWITVKAATAQYLDQREYAKATETYGTLYPALHQFFEKVFIMDENLDVRRNRLALMREIHVLYANAVGDLSKLPLPNDL